MLASGLLLVTVLAFLVILVLMSVWKQRELSGKMPPGPTPLPFIGNYLQLNTEEIYNSLMKIRERYGPVFTVHLGPRRRIVILCGQEAVKEALVDHALEFSGRGENATFDWLFKGYGVAFSPWERSKPLRRFSIATLRDFGMGKRGIEERIQEEADYLLEALQKTNGALIDPTFYLSRTVSNVMSSIVFGNRFDYEDKEFLSLLKMMTESFQFTASSTGQLYEMFSSVMKHLPGPQQKAFKELQGLEDFITKKVEQHQSTLDSNSPRDFIDSFLIHMQAEKKNPNTEFYMKNLVLTTLNLFFAGTETVSTTLRYGFLLLMKHPDVEAKIHEEINQVIGRNRQPKYEDRMKMPYTEAVIHEIQRFADLIPMGLPRRVTKDTKFRDFLIPKGTEVFPMLGSVLNDPKFFSNPKDFNPKHFLDDNGQFKKNDAFIPFSLGKRNCFGEGLARMELFLYLTNILQNFHLRSSQAPRDIDVSPKMVGFGTIPPNYTMSFLSH
ncbi:cytochrome P450 2A17 [Cricetulus griseus]|uniref:Cytochrome P450 n=1 Tax=Cricetulus griseus TaxID=10029 RepID=Q9JM91_CRIGR|nr:cytochrome P450 2A17 [Cricetulus griseus]BAA93554.1 cytochrome P450 2A17 [Cricetulus griseus]